MITKSECGVVHGPNWMKWCGQWRGQHVYGLEIGTYQGASAEFFLDNIFTHERAKYYCVDTFLGSAEHARLGIDCTKNEGLTRHRLSPFGDRAVIVRGRSDERLPELKAQGLRLHVAYVDGAHDSANVLRDAAMVFDMMVVSGVIVFDDYYWREMPEPLDNPKDGIDSFLAAYAKHLRVLHIGPQVAIEKTSEVP